MFLVVQFFTPETGDQANYDGTFTIPPLTFGHLPPAVSEAAFLKGNEWLEKRKTAA